MSKKLLALLASALLCWDGTLGQGTFQNLDLEAARLVFPGQLVATTNALPSWSAFYGADQLAQIGYNVASAVPPVQLYGSNSLVIAGNFSVALLRNGAFITQTALVPGDARWLLFKSTARSASPLLVSLGGQDLPYALLSSGPNYKLYGADISAFAGQVSTLRFLSPTTSEYVIDDIEFAVPEPSALALLGAGVCFYAVHRFRRRQEISSPMGVSQSACGTSNSRR